jgi:hypothetical protein
MHMAALFSESGVADKQMREKLLMREVGEEILRKGLMEEGMLEKPKRRAAALEADRVRLSDDGEFVPVDDNDDVEQVEPGTPRVRSNHAGHS